MADAAAKKREARRKRILENSGNRLKKITGLYSNAGNSEPNNDLFEEPVSYEESSTILSETSDRLNVKELEVITNVESFMETPPAPENVPITDKSLWEHTSSKDTTPLSSSASSLTTQTTSPVLYILCRKARIHIIALAVIIRILLTSPCAVLFGESALIPLCTVEFVEWINTKLQKSEAQTPSGLLGMALMLSGLAPQKASYLLGVFDVFNKITQDFFIYFFAFSVTHAFLEVFS